MKNKVTSDDHYKKISIQNFAKLLNIEVITSIHDFIASDYQSEVVKKNNIDLHNPYIIEGILFIFCTDGIAKIKINFFEYEIKSDSLLIVLPSSILQLINQSKDFRVKFLFFTFDFISSIQLTLEFVQFGKKIESFPLLELNPKLFFEFTQIHKNIVKQSKQIDYYREDSIRSSLYGMIFKIFQFYSENFHEKKNIPIRGQEILYKKFISLLFEYYKKERNVKFYADKLNLTPKYFSKIIKETTGLTVSDRIDEMVIMGAKALLKSTDLTVSQISEELNFASPSFFGTYFKKRTNLTPAQYRENSL